MSTLSEDDAEALKALNDTVKNAIAARTAWLDEHMPKYAKYAIGEELFDLDTGRSLGTVHNYYRYWAEQRNPTYDTGLNIEYKLRVQENVYDNTSRHAGRISFGNRAELERRRKR
jgi:hypothetical protein